MSSAAKGQAVTVSVEPEFVDGVYLPASRYVLPRGDMEREGGERGEREGGGADKQRQKTERGGGGGEWRQTDREI